MRVFISCETSLQKPMPSIVHSAPRSRNENKSDPPGSRCWLGSMILAGSGWAIMPELFNAASPIER